jgi:hypothetical protein
MSEGAGFFLLFCFCYPCITIASRYGTDDLEALLLLFLMRVESSILISNKIIEYICLSVIYLFVERNWVLWFSTIFTCVNYVSYLHVSCKWKYSNSFPLDQFSVQPCLVYLHITILNQVMFEIPQDTANCWSKLYLMCSWLRGRRPNPTAFLR